MKEWIKTGATLIVCAMLTWVLWDVHALLRDARQTTMTTLRDFHTTVLEIGLTAANLRKASLAWEQSSKDQAAQTTAAMSNVSVAAGRLSTFISRTDDSMNLRLIPALTAAIEQQNASLLATQRDLQVNLSRMSQATAQLQKTLVDADAQITDPAVKESLANIAEGTKNASEATAQLEKTVENFRIVTDKFRETYTKPGSTLWATLKGLIHLIFETRGALQK
jgi:hypothetical protein